jgi:Dehydroquinase class II
MRLAILHGPNLNRLGERDPAKYGATTLADITRDIDETATRLGVTTQHFQSNFEGALTEWIHDRHTEVDGYVVNPAGLSSHGYAWLDALRDTGNPRPGLVRCRGRRGDAMLVQQPVLLDRTEVRRLRSRAVGAGTGRQVRPA